MDSMRKLIGIVQTIEQFLCIDDYTVSIRVAKT